MELEVRTKQFALDLIDLVERLPAGGQGMWLGVSCCLPGHQLGRTIAKRIELNQKMIWS
jgi:hypothetical protein